MVVVSLELMGLKKMMSRWMQINYYEKVILKLAKHFVILFVLAAHVGCYDKDNQLKGLEESRPYEIIANTTNGFTRTSTTDAGDINWSAGDKLNVFHTITGSSQYGGNDCLPRILMEIVRNAVPVVSAFLVI